MAVIQIVLDKKLLDAADRVVRRMKKNRSALVRDALREHLRTLEIRAREEQDRAGYARQPQSRDQQFEWEEEAAWPNE